MENATTAMYYQLTTTVVQPLLVRMRTLRVLMILFVANDHALNVERSWVIQKTLQIHAKIMQWFNWFRHVIHDVKFLSLKSNKAYKVFVSER